MRAKSYSLETVQAMVGDEYRIWGEVAKKAISYQTGSLENAEIRRSVCEILEGGESAFRERARRLRVRLER